MLIGRKFVEFAPQLGYKAVFFNLVFEDNIASIRIWQALGFTTTGRVPNAARRKDGTYQNALQMYYEFKPAEA